MTVFPRVFHVMASAEQGGGADHLLSLLPELTHLDWECVVATGMNGPLGESLLAQGFQVRMLDLMRSRWNLGSVIKFRRFIENEHPDVLHVHGTRAAFYGAFAKARLFRRSIPSVYTVHGLSYRKEKTWLKQKMFAQIEKFICSSFDSVISVSAHDLADLRQRGLLYPNKGLHIPNAVDTVRFCPGDRLVARQYLKIAPDAFWVGTVSRLVPQKAVVDLIEAVKGCENIHLVIVGDGPLREVLQTKAQSLLGRVMFLGSRNDVPEILRALDLFVLPSHWEGEPIALLEALATGLPTLATATTGACEIASSTKGVFLVDIGAIQQMREAILSLQKDSIRRQYMGEAGREAMLLRTHKQQAAQIAAVYQTVMKKHGDSEGDEAFLK